MNPEIVQPPDEKAWEDAQTEARELGYSDALTDDQMIEMAYWMEKATPQP